MRECSHCHAPLGRLRADDAPPYFTIFLVGHVLVPLVLWVEKAYEPPMWLHMVVWLPLFTIICTVLLRPIKGAVVGWMSTLGFVSQEPERRWHGPPRRRGRAAAACRTPAPTADGHRRSPADPALRRLENVVLPDSTALLSAYAEADRRQAVADLLVENSFDPTGVPGGPSPCTSASATAGWSSISAMRWTCRCGRWPWPSARSAG